MRSKVADELRSEGLAAVRGLSAGQRVHLALELGARDRRALAAAQGIGLEEASQRIRAAAQRGRRRPSACAR